MEKIEYKSSRQLDELDRQRKEELFDLIDSRTRNDSAEERSKAFEEFSSIMNDPVIVAEQLIKEQEYAEWERIQAEVQANR